jgi:sugar/nucleoside kinase (ribokinase family)
LKKVDFHFGNRHLPSLMSSYSFDLIGVGSPIVDSLARVPDAFIAQSGGEKGGMVMVDEAGMAALIGQLEEPPVQAPGGSAGNTVVGASRLGIKSSFLGKLGGDESARFYKDRFEQAGIDTSRFKVGGLPNARCLSLVTPDSQRTMRTFLGAAMTFGAEEVSVSDFAGCRHAHIEGYVLFNRDLAVKVLESAKEAGCTVSLDLASFEVVGASREILPGLLKNYVDVVFANEDEAAAFCGEGKAFDVMAAELASFCQVAVVKMGKDGAWIVSGGEKVRVEPRVATAIDTTGAGDLWAGGFLAGWLSGLSLEQSGKIGSLLGAEVVQVMGAALPEERWEAILPGVKALGLG